MELTHVTHNVRIAPRKLRLVIDKVRHMPASRAMEVLPHIINKGAGIAAKSLKSAVQVAKDKNLSEESLVIQRIFVGEGRKLKRGIHRSKGRTLPLIKHSSHLSIVLVGEEQSRARRAPRKAVAEVAPEVVEQPQEETV